MTDYLSNDNRVKFASLKCVVFVRPTAASLDLLVREFREPRYREYYLCIPLLTSDRFSPIDFSNFLKNSYLEMLAEADECEVIREVQVSSHATN